MTIEFSIINHSNAHQVVDLFEEVFTASAGEEEGRLLKQLVTKLVDETRQNDLLGFCALESDHLVGAIFFSRLTIPAPTLGFMLSPVAIDSDYQGKGIGQKLIGFGLEQLKNLGVVLVVTYGDPAFYSKTGFKQVSTELIEPPYPLSQPIGWLAQMLNNQDIQPSKGKLGCVKAFNNPDYW
ncbi:GNAT family N-acetyltransferase [Neptuniibacter sp. SY11_33]|uniref:GNAT family N-acetyltransferase n=1 Tax=Neptuniibacter sp. SY11_33 TaxID=3398215 RepID=UPI0039F61943